MGARIADRRTVPRRSRYPLGMAIRIVLGHGASGSAAKMGHYVSGFATRGIEALAVDLPVRRAEDAVEPFRGQVPAGPVALGGQSYGGRVASLIAAEPPDGPGPDPIALVLFSYPLHRPGAPDGETRAAHWPAIRCPVLLLSGEADPFARIDLLRSAVGTLRDGELVTYPKLGHTLKPVFDDALDRAAAFLQEVAART